MKYKKIVWWKHPKDCEIDLVKEICKEKNLNLVIVENVDDFNDSIDSESFLVLSILLADKYLRKIKKIMMEHDSQKFNFQWRFDDKRYTLNELRALNLQNAVKPEDPLTLLKRAQE